MKFSLVLLCGVAAAALSACEVRPRETASTSQTSAPPASSMPSQAPAPAAAPPSPSAAPVAQAVDHAVFAEAPTPDGKRDMLLRAQVLLDRAHFSPGVIDGQDGENVRNAIAAYERANDLPEDGVLDARVWEKAHGRHRAGAGGLRRQRDGCGWPLRPDDSQGL